MPTAPPKSVTLRRSCQRCAKGKRRCDLRSPECSRCLKGGLNCVYINAPLAVSTSSRQSVDKPYSYHHKRHGKICNQIQPPLRLEIGKEYNKSTIRFLVNGIRDLPRSYAQGRKTLFIHPEVYESETPTPLRDVNWLCKLHVQAEQADRARDLSPLLRRKLTEYARRLSGALGIEELLGYSQALILIHCVLSLSEEARNEYSDTTSTMLEWIAQRLWQQAPTQLPSSLSPKRAWLLAESVRRTIITSLMLRSAYSLHTRNYSVRTPFVDALPFDTRLILWDQDSDKEWRDFDSTSHHSMISLHEYSDALEHGRVYDVTQFSALILAACKGKEISAVPFPPTRTYVVG